MNFGELHSQSVWSYSHCMAINSHNGNHPIQRNIKAYLCASDVFFDKRCGGLLQRVLQEREWGRSVPQTQQFRDQEQIMRPPMRQINRSHGAMVRCACGSEIAEVGLRGAAAKFSRSNLQLRLDGSGRDAALLRALAIFHHRLVIFVKRCIIIRGTFRALFDCLLFWIPSVNLRPTAAQVKLTKTPLPESRFER